MKRLLTSIKQLQEVTGSDSVDPSIRKHLKKLKQYSNIPRKKAKFQNFCKNSVNIYDQPTLDKLWDAFSGGDKVSTENEKSSNGAAKVSDPNNEEKIKSSKDEPNDKDTTKTDNKKEKKKKKKKEVEDVEEHKKSKKKDDQECENGLGKRNKRKRKQNEIENEQDEPSGKITRIEENNNMEEENVEKDIKGNFNWGRIIKKALKEAPDNELPVKKLRKKVLAEFKSSGDNRPFTDNELRALFEKKLNKNPKIKVKKDTARLCKT